jgi:hypothetical protein
MTRIGATVHVRVGDGWNVLVLNDDDTLALPEIDLAIPLAEFYEGLIFHDHPVEDNDSEQTPSRPDLFAAVFGPFRINAPGRRYALRR